MVKDFKHRTSLQGKSKPKATQSGVFGKDYALTHSNAKPQKTFREVGTGILAHVATKKTGKAVATLFAATGIALIGAKALLGSVGFYDALPAPKNANQTKSAKPFKPQEEEVLQKRMGTKESSPAKQHNAAAQKPSAASKDKANLDKMIANYIETGEMVKLPARGQKATVKADQHNFK